MEREPMSTTNAVESISPPPKNPQIVGDSIALPCNLGTPVAPTPAPTKILDTAKTWFARIRKVKHIEIYAAVLVVVLMVGIYFTTFASPSTNGDPVDSALRATEREFAQEMERRLVSTLGQVRGAGRVDAMVTVSGSSMLELAYSTDERSVTQSGGQGSSTTTTTVVRTPIVVGGQPVVLFHTKPQIRGIVIVAQGAGDGTVRLAIMRAVQTLVACNDVNIEILIGR